MITNEQRKQVEELIYKTLDTIDTTQTNSDYYREIFSKMDNKAFYDFFTRRLPIRFHYEPFKIEPTMDQIFKAFKILDKPLLEKVNLKHLYVNKDGIPVSSKECMVIYIHIKRMKQIVADKSHVSMEIAKRDMKTGLLTGDKGSGETDREFESLAAFGLEYTMDELSRVRADSLRAATQMNQVILSKGTVSDKDINVEKSDSLAKNLLNVYLIGAGIHSNLIDVDYMTPHTSSRRNREIERLI